MISFILALVAAVIYSLIATEPSIVTAIAITINAFVILRLMTFTLALYYTMKVITLNPKLEADFRAAMKKYHEG